MFPVEVPSIGEVDAVSAKLDETGIHRPIKDGLDDDGMGTLSADCPSVLTPSTVGAAARLLSNSSNSLMISSNYSSPRLRPWPLSLPLVSGTFERGSNVGV